MPRFIVKLSKDGVDRYFEWSTVVDAPVTYGLTLEEFREHYRDEYGESGMENLNGRLERVEATGCSAHRGVDTLDGLLRSNRCAGWEKNVFPPKPPNVEADGETYEDLSWTFDEIWEFYVTRRPDDDDPESEADEDEDEDEADDDEPPPGWRFLYDPEGLDHVPPCVPSQDLVHAVGRLFDHGQLLSKDDDTLDQPLSTPRKLEEARQINAELLAILQP